MTVDDTLVGRPAPPPPSRRRALADDDVAALVEAMPGLPLPPLLVSRWPLAADEVAVARARLAAYERMTRTGVMTHLPDGPTGVVDAMNPAVLDALALPGVADVHVQVRSWYRDVSFVAALATSGDRGVGMVRRWVVGRAVDRGGVSSSARPGMELSAFAGESLLAEILRTVPPVEGDPADADDGSETDLSALDAAALVAALREDRLDVARALCAKAGLGQVPSVLDDLAVRWDGALEISVRRPDGAVPPVTGTWWIAGGRWLRALVSAGSTAPAAADEALTPPGDERLAGLLSLRPTTRKAVADDVLAALVAQASALGPGDDRG